MEVLDAFNGHRPLAVLQGHLHIVEEIQRDGTMSTGRKADGRNAETHAWVDMQRRAGLPTRRSLWRLGGVRQLSEAGDRLRDASREAHARVDTGLLGSLFWSLKFSVIREEPMLDMQRIVPVTKAKKELLDMIRQLSDEDATFTVTKNGVPVGVLMTPERFEALLETIEILADTRMVKALARSQKDFADGRIVAHTEVWSNG